MPAYRIYEVFPDGTLHDVNRIIECYDTDSYGSNSSFIIRAVFEAYGFGKAYDSYYKASAPSYGDKDKIHVTYNYLGDGNKSTWVLIKEDNNEKEENNE